MTPKDVLKFYKTQAAAAHALRIQQPSVALWVKQGRIPHGRQAQLQLITGGALRADFPKRRRAK